MKNNISNSEIFNRKIIIELRFDNKVVFFDKKGILVDSLRNELNMRNNEYWEIGNSNILITDTEKKEDANESVYLTLNSFGFISKKVESVDSYWNKFQKIYDQVLNILGSINVIRIGCRIIGTYKSKSNEFSSILNNFKEVFPNKFLLNNYPTKDLLFRLTYQNGMYQIGPINKDDNFLKREFINNYQNNIGFAIDTDNYVTNDKKKINEKNLIYNVYLLSLSVEKDLYYNLKDF
jgi:hypothetical protein